MACLEFHCNECGEYWANNGTRLQQCPRCCCYVRSDFDEVDDDHEPEAAQAAGGE